NMRRRVARSPLVKKLAVLVEDLNAVVFAVVDIDAPGDGIGGNTVDAVEVCGARFLAHLALLSPGHEVFAVLVEFRYASAVVAIGYKHGSVGQPSKKGRPVEMLAVVTGLVSRAEFQHHLFSVVRKLVDLAAR